MYSIQTKKDGTHNSQVLYVVTAFQVLDVSVLIILVIDCSDGSSLSSLTSIRKQQELIYSFEFFVNLC